MRVAMIASYTLSRLDAFVEQPRARYQLVVRHRFHSGILPGAMPPLYRYLANLANPLLTAIGRLVFRSVCGDSATCTSVSCSSRDYRRR